MDKSIRICNFQRNKFHYIFICEQLHRSCYLRVGYVVHNADELEKIMAVGNKNRHIGATAMNIESSRSHAIFSITVENSKRGADGKMHVKMGKLHLVDLAVRSLFECFRHMGSVTNR